MQQEMIIIVGAGIAGLTAALELSAKYQVLILEGAPLPGGRIRSYTSAQFTRPVEAGAEFIHGNLKETFALLKQANIGIVPVEGNMYRMEKQEWLQQHSMTKHWDLLLKKMRSVKTDMTMFDFLQEHFSGDEFSDLRRQATAYTEGFDIADVKQASVQALYKEWSQEDEENYRIPEGYMTLVNWLVQTCEAAGCRMICNDAVKQIDWQKNDVTVYTEKSQKYVSEKLLITVPIKILQLNSGTAAINFTPALDEQVNAARQFGFGPVIKVLMEFKAPFWQADAGFIISDEMIPTWWTQLPDNIPLLTGWAGGTKAEILSSDNEESLTEKAIRSLSNIYGISIQELKDDLIAVKIFNWQNNDWSLGAYSYATPYTQSAKKILNQSIEDTIYFSGEALYDGASAGTVEAAIVHAKQVSKKILG